jgi:hypothetical protein
MTTPNRALLAWVLGLSLAALGCGSPIVGAECAQGYVAVGRMCVPIGDADVDAGPDGGPDAGPDAGDAGPDASDLGPDVPEAGPDADDPDAPDGGCSCVPGEFCCMGTCIDPNTDDDHCGSCEIACEADEYCDARVCTPFCAPGLTYCPMSGLCVDTTIDPDNCGGCNVICASGICDTSTCQTGQVGHVVLIGHDYTETRLDQRRVAGNALFIPPLASVRVLVYEGTARPVSINGVDAAFNEVAMARMRTWTRTVAPTAADVPTLLGGADVFVVYSQRSSDATIQALGTTWAASLATFLNGGGVIVVFDAGGTNAGTWQLLDTAGLLDVQGRTSIDRQNVMVQAFSDTVAIGLPPAYRAENNSSAFTSADGATVVVSHPSGPVVLHQVVTP